MAQYRLPDSDVPVGSRAAAAPVDTFVQARKVSIEDSGLADLTRALGSLAPSLGALAADSNRLFAEQEERRGRDAGMRGEATPEDASRFRKRAQEETLGLYKDASEADARRRAAWNDPRNEARNSDDPEVLRKWLEDFRKAELANMSEDRQRGFLARNAEFEQRLLSEHNDFRARQREKEALSALGSSMVAEMRRVIASGGNAAAAIAAAQEASAGMQYAGLKGEMVNDALATAALAVARETGRESILQAVQGDRPDVRAPGKAIPGIRDPQWVLRFTEAEKAIKAQRMTEENHRMAMQERAERQAGAQAAGRAEKALFDWQAAVLAAQEKGEPAPPPPGISAEDQRILMRTRPEYLSHYRGATFQLQQLGKKQSPQLGQDAMGAIYDAVSNGEDAPGALLRVIREKGITDPQLMNQLSDFARFAPTASRDVLESSAVRGAMSQVGSVVPQDRLSRPEVLALQADAGRFVKHSALAWEAQFRRENNRAPTAEERFKAMDAVGNQAAEYVRAWMDASDPNKARWEPGAPLPMPQEIPLPPPAAPAAPPPARLRENGQVVQSDAQAQRPLESPGTRIGRWWNGTPETLPMLPQGGPLNIPDQGIQRWGTVPGRGPEINYSPLRSRPSEEHLMTLFQGMQASPNNYQLMREFDATYGRNAALYYLREYNNRITAGATTK